jgi:hypothetical protein
MLKELAPRNRIYNLIAPIIFGLIFVILGYHILTENYSGKALFILAVIFGLLFIWFIKVSKTYNFYYDNANLILKNQKTIIKVHFTKINKIKLTLSDLKIMGMNHSEYRIEFFDEENELKSKSFWTISGGNEKFDNFEKSIKIVNPKVDIQNYASTLDQ